MGKITDWVKKTFTYATHPELWGNSFFYPVGLLSSLNWGDNTEQQNLKDFMEVPEVNAVINYRAWAQSLVELDCLSITTNKPVANTDPLVKVFRNPNWFQTQKELWRQTELFRCIFGNEYLYFLTPVGMPKSYKAMFTLPPQYTKIIYPPKPIPFFLLSEPQEGLRYEYTWQGEQKKIDYNSILQLNDNNVDQKPENYLSGTSKLNPLKVNIRNIRASYEARNVILENRGAIGILSNNAKDGIGASMPMNPKEKERVQQELTKHGVMKGQYKYIMTNLNLKWTQITTDLDKLRVFKEVLEDFKMICVEYGTPYEIFAGTDVTYENKEKAEKQFYQDTIIPTTIERVKAINDFFGLESKSWRLVGSFDHLPLFQEDLKERSEALNTLVSALNVALMDGAINIDQYKDELQKFNIKKNNDKRTANSE